MGEVKLSPAARKLAASTLRAFDLPRRTLNRLAGLAALYARGGERRGWADRFEADRPERAALVARLPKVQSALATLDDALDETASRFLLAFPGLAANAGGVGPWREALREIRQRVGAVKVTPGLRGRRPPRWRERFAADVALVLLAAGLPVKKSRDGLLCATITELLDQMGEPVPGDLWRLVKRTADRAPAEHAQRQAEAYISPETLREAEAAGVRVVRVARK